VSGFFIAIRPTPTTIINFRTLPCGSSGFGLEELSLNFFHKPTVDVGRSIRLSSVGSVTHITIARNRFGNFNLRSRVLIRLFFSKFAFRSERLLENVG
jgi:hypothetical protein